MQLKDDLKNIGIEEQMLKEGMCGQEIVCCLYRIRKELLERIHADQRKLQELDYLIYIERKDGI